MKGVVDCAYDAFLFNCCRASLCVGGWNVSAGLSLRGRSETGVV